MYIRAKVEAGTKKEIFQKVSKTEFKIQVKEPAERNMANKRILELLARHFQTPVKKVRIISGHHSPSKIISVDIDSDTDIIKKGRNY